MKTRTLVLVLTGFVLAALPAAVHAQFNYATNSGGTITITGYTGPGGAVVIPATTNGLPVTSIGSEAFYYCTSLTSITIPDSVTTIENGSYDWDGLHENLIFFGAFYGCSSLTNVTLGNGITDIGRFAFIGCSSLPAITIPESVTSIAAGSVRNGPQNSDQ